MVAAATYHGAAKLRHQQSLRLRVWLKKGTELGWSNRKIARKSGFSHWTIRRLAPRYRQALLPTLSSHQLTRASKLYLDVVGLARHFSLTEDRVRFLTERSSAPFSQAVGKNGHLTKIYDLEQIRPIFEASRKRATFLNRPRQLRESLKLERYQDLTESEMAALLALVILLRETAGQPPTYEEIEHVAGLPARKAHSIVPKLVRGGFLTQLPVLNPRRGQPRYRYLVHRAPAKLVSQPTRCPDCGSTIWIPYPWYQAKRNGDGTTH